jgi:hypothetical protein
MALVLRNHHSVHVLSSKTENIAVYENLHL